MKLLVSVLFLGLVSCASHQVSGDRQVASEGIVNLNMTTKLLGSTNSGETTYLISNPVEKGIAVKYSASNASVRESRASEENGVCYRLGYERAVPKSSRASIYWNHALRVLGSKGKEVQGTYTKTMSKITCINKRTVSSDEQSLVLLGYLQLKHPDSGLGFSASNTANGKNFSHESGVCKVLGYSDGVVKSSLSDGRWEDVIAVDQSGSIISGPYAKRMVRITCIK